MDTNISKGVAVDIEMGVTKATSDGSHFANWIVDIEARAGNTNKESQEELLWKTASIYKEQDNYINGLVLNLVAENCSTVTNTLLGLHALDLFRRSLLNPEPKVQPTQSEPPQSQSEQVGPEPKLQHTQSDPPQNQYEQVDIIRCAIELHEAGVRFKKSETNNLKNIRFNSITGKFHLPFLKVDDATECSLLNVIAFEYLHANLAPDVTTYVTVMDEIIDSANDVRLLHNKGLILSTLGSDEEVARIFNSMGKEITMHHDDNLSEVTKNVSRYRRKRRHRWRAYLISTYFRNPWTIISLAGALLVIALTIAQTVYASREN